MTNQLSRFRILDQNSLQMPGRCVVCGTSSGNFIDFGFDLDFYGAIYFCFENCFREAANAFGYHNPRQHEVVLNEVEYLRKENNGLKDQIEEMTRVFRDLTDSIAANSIARASDISVVEESEHNNQTSNKNNPGLEEEGGGSIEQINEQGSTDIQRDDSIDSFIDKLDI